MTDRKPADRFYGVDRHARYPGPDREHMKSKKRRKAPSPPKKQDQGDGREAEPRKPDGA